MNPFYCVLFQCFSEVLCTLTSDLILPEVELCECLNKMKKMNITEMNRMYQAHCILLQCMTKISCTLWSNLIVSEVQICKYLYETEKMNMIEMNKLIQYHCVLFKCLTKILRTLIYNLIVAASCLAVSCPVTKTRTKLFKIVYRAAIRELNFQY
jgi:hypothetical protein